MSEWTLRGLSDDDLLTHLGTLCAEDCALKAKIVAYLVEVEDRSLHLRLACSSMHDFCVRIVKMGPSMTFRRLAAARIVRRHPCFLPALARGEIHIETLLVLRDHLTEANAEELLAAARGRSTHDIEMMLVARAPKPDVPGTVVPISEQCSLPASSSATTPRRGRSSRVTPLSPSRYEVKFTASQGTRDKLERAIDLMRHRNPAGDIAVVFDSALDALLAKLEKECLGTTDRPQRERRGIRRGAISRGARREVFARDGERCTFEDGIGNRCPAKGFLQLDHVTARALGGDGEASNLRVLCGPHNRFMAEVSFGRAHVEHAIDDRRQSSRTTLAASPAMPEPAIAMPPAAAEQAATFDAEGAGAQSASSDAAVASRRLALEGLTRLGFKRTEATRALDTVLRRRGDADSPTALPEVLREALGLLT